MIGIYHDGFMEHLKKNLGETVKTNPKNIICPCPWCDIDKPQRSKDHLWIALDAPIFHCFRGGCNKSGVISKLLFKISGNDTSNKFIDKNKIKEFKFKRSEFEKNVFKFKELIIPPLNESMFTYKALYVRQRLKFTNIPLEKIKGLVFDVNEFIRVNGIQLEEKVLNFSQYLQTNFVGFVTEHNCSCVLRNVDPHSSFRYYKLKIQDSPLLDYYLLPGGNRNSKNIVLSEGIFDIYTEHIFDSIKMKNNSSIYAAALFSKYQSLVKSLVFYEQIFRPNIHILSDKEIDVEYYKKFKFFNKHIIDSLIVYYNKTGKDFNDTPLKIVRELI